MTMLDISPYCLEKMVLTLGATLSNPDTKVILEEILGVEINKLLNLGIEQKECHKLLGISGDATKIEINQAYRQLAKVHHPDKGGDAEMMKKLNRAKAEALAA